VTRRRVISLVALGLLEGPLVRLRGTWSSYATVSSVTRPGSLAGALGT
jgi:hypothetical protein